HQAMGARARARSRAAASRCQSAGNTPASRDGRASFRHAEDADGGDSLSDEAPAEGCHRDGLARARLQSHARHEYRRRSTTPGGDEGIVLRCAVAEREMHPNAGGGPTPGKCSGAAKRAEVVSFHTTKTHKRHRPPEFAVPHNAAFRRAL